jgi:hypothetical protein
MAAAIVLAAVEVNAVGSRTRCCAVRVPAVLREHTVEHGRDRVSLDTSAATRIGRVPEAAI